MHDVLLYLSIASVTAVFVVLAMGLITMTRGANVNLSQQLMRWRVGLQFASVVILMATVYIVR